MNDIPNTEERAAMDAECESFAQAAAPLIQWLAENRHPHTKAIVTATGAELLEGCIAIHNERFILD